MGHNYGRVGEAELMGEDEVAALPGIAARPLPERIGPFGACRRRNAEGAWTGAERSIGKKRRRPEWRRVFLARFRRMPTANAEGPIESEGGVGKVSVRLVFR